ncbi:uncharacterized protein LOC130934068 [Arachis stenosperma]|uniref:uncharacterized protein LOC130934068 n=1 Tax=Arachis stenosperma TaxID=217475 RepID=UPI0025AC9571|nr:uncharacterized protein LOC130934068 [Arachis stenosperma]
MAKRIDSLQVASVNVTTQPPIGWGSNEENQEDQQQEQVQYVYNQGSGSNEVYGDTYNPSWKNHPNLRWRDSHNQNQQPWQRNSNHNNSRNTNNNNQQNTNPNPYRKPQNNHSNSNYYPATNQNNFHPPSTPHNQPQISQDTQRISNLEILMEKMMKHQEMTSKNHEASMRNLERQIGQLSKQAVIERPTSSLPSDTITNPKEECKAIQLRSGRTLVNNKEADKELMGNEKRATEEDEAVLNKKRQRSLKRRMTSHKIQGNGSK